MFHDLWIGIDEEARSDAAVEVGLFLAETFDAQLELVHAVRVEQRPWWVEGKKGWEEARKRILAAAFESRRAHLDELGAARHVKLGDMLRVVEGDPAQVLAELATPADLIVLGEHKKKGLLDLSGTARRLLSLSPCPIWVQREPWRNRVRKILVPVDMSVQSALTADLAIRMAHTFGARVLMLHAFEPPFHSYLASRPDQNEELGFVIEDYRRLEQEALEHFVERLPVRDIELDAVFVDGRPAEKILEAQAEADLVVMGTHGHTGVLRTVLGSVARKVVTLARKPVLAVPHVADEDAPPQPAPVPPKKSTQS